MVGWSSGNILGSRESMNMSCFSLFLQQQWAQWSCFFYSRLTPKQRPVRATLWAAGSQVSLEPCLQWSMFYILFNFFFHKRISRLAPGSFGNIFEGVYVLFHPGCSANEGPPRHESAQVCVWRCPSFPRFDFRSVSWARLPSSSLPWFQWCCWTSARGEWLHGLASPGKWVLEMRVHRFRLGPFYFFSLCKKLC